MVDALEAAGGERTGVDLSIPQPGPGAGRRRADRRRRSAGDGAGRRRAARPCPASPTTLVNLNTATQAELETLPDVGPVTALAILAWRDEHGGFTSVDELLEVDGIGEATLGKLTPYVTV